MIMKEKVKQKFTHSKMAFVWWDLLINEFVYD
jgi:hypothetical protein